MYVRSTLVIFTLPQHEKIKNLRNPFIKTRQEPKIVIYFATTGYA